MSQLSGKVWCFGDNIDTDLIIAARYLNTSDPKELAKHVMEDADPESAASPSVSTSPTPTSFISLICASRN